jgi:hypothetical protein
MALAKGVNAYADRNDADAYFADRLDVAAWTAASDTSKDQALVTASLALNDYEWVGIAASEDQTLAWPRSGSYTEPVLGYATQLDDTAVPDRVLNATYELAHHLLNNDGLLDDTGSVRELQVGQIHLSIRSMPSTLPPVVLRLLKPMLSRGGSNAWWRAN